MIPDELPIESLGLQDLPPDVGEGRQAEEGSFGIPSPGVLHHQAQIAGGGLVRGQRQESAEPERLLEIVPASASFRVLPGEEGVPGLLHPPVLDQAVDGGQGLAVGGGRHQERGQDPGEAPHADLLPPGLEARAIRARSQVWRRDSSDPPEDLSWRSSTWSPSMAAASSSPDQPRACPPSWRASHF